MLEDLNSLIVFQDLRISKDVTDNHLYPVFYDNLAMKPFLTSDLRQEIINKWRMILPNVPIINLRMQLSRMERSYFENLEVIDRNGLRNRILEQQASINEMAIQSNQSGELPLDKMARVITESNKLSANVAGLSDMPPQIEVVINTNAPNDLAIRMNRSVIENQVNED